MSLLPSVLSSQRVWAAGCYGDEQILLAPAEPHVGSQLIVAAVSRFAHEQVLLLGPDGPLEVKRAPIGDRYVWQATVVPSRAGEHLFAFGVAGSAVPLVTCADARAVVADSVLASSPAAATDGESGSSDPPAGDASALVALLNPYGRGGQATTLVNDPVAPVAASTDPPLDLPPTVSSSSETGTPRPTDTRRPTRTPTRRSATSNANENGNDNDGGPTPTRTPTLTRTPTPTREPTETRTPRPEPTDTPVPTSTRTPRPDPTDPPAPAATDTPRPTATHTPRPDPSDTPVPQPTSTKTPRPDPTDTATPTPTLAPPAVADWAPESAVCGQLLTIHGQRFGVSRGAVDGRVTVDGRDTEVLSWEMAQIKVKVPLTVRPGNDRQLMIVVAGQVVTSSSLRISC